MTRSNTPMMVDRYRILSLLGRGAMSRVYRAWDTKLNREVAIKMAPRHLPEDERQRRLHEAQVIAQLAHPNIVQIFDSAPLDAPTPYLVIEKLDGVDLFAVAAALGPLDERDVLAIAYELTFALEAVHKAQIIHRDVKPENVVITRDGRIVLTDFGIAKTLSAGETEVTPSDKTDVIGTPGFMAPEAMRGDPYGPSIDLFGLGALIYNLLTGHMPFAGKTHLDIYYAAKAGKVTPPSEFRLSFTRDMMRLIKACLAPLAVDRPADACSVQKQLAQQLLKNSKVDVRQVLRELAERVAHPEVLTPRRQVHRFPRLKGIGRRANKVTSPRRLAVAAVLLAVACSLAGHLWHRPEQLAALVVAQAVNLGAVAAPVAGEAPAPTHRQVPPSCAVKPDVAAFHSEMIESMRPQMPGHIRFQVPLHARVSLDGRIVGARRQEGWQVVPGLHAVVIRVAPDWDAHVARFVVFPGRELRIVTEDNGTMHFVS